MHSCQTNDSYSVERWRVYYKGKKREAIETRACYSPTPQADAFFQPLKLHQNVRYGRGFVPG
jgi:hypothetical protein